MNGFTNAAKKRDERRNPVVRYNQFMQQQWKIVHEVSYKALDGPSRPPILRNSDQHICTNNNNNRPVSESGSAISEIVLERFPSARSNTSSVNCSSVKAKVFMMNNFLTSNDKDKNNKERVIFPPILNKGRHNENNKKETNIIKYRPRG